MKATLAKWLCAALMLLSQTGCWDLKTIQDTNYMTAIGFDYKDGKYIVYGQMLDFASVAKQEAGQSSQPPLIWVGKEEGVTVNDAFNKLYQTSQQRVFWGHVGAYLFTKDALNKGIANFVDGSIRYSETRFTQWVYSTDDPIESIFSVIPFFNVSPMNSLLMQPIDNYRQISLITPHRLFWLVSRYREPGNTVMIPSLSIDKGVWKKNTKPDAKLRYSGVYALNKYRDLQWVSETQYRGARWLDQYTSRTPVNVFKDGEPAQSVSVTHPKAKIKPHVNGDQAIFDIEIKAKASVQEILRTLDEATLKSLIEQQIKEEIIQTFELGKSHKVDVYRFEHVLYKDDFPAWAKLTDKGEKPLSDFVLGEVTIKLDILHSGMLRMDNHRSDQY
ncbi:hypothetical protein A8709_05825 [Paenibacillus pectinilyticus]|uniref:Uncharacterized protein n=1 Tax=Paenibacillus pectinilyticus TaxID=512399 RepID=A0A1C0ZSZ2_9BACL|nr:Ger(x)C family spore germination protein [Paenibacillus pectinilyticus]OCT11198.1 hypothetical protein A8709_05825 [Paenibacillus pectinilyticus]